jgi:hypothetical protein
MIEHGETQLVYSRESQLHLRLNAGRPRNTKLRAGSEVVQKRCLADTRFPTYGQGPTLTGTHGINEPIEDRAFVTTPDQLAHGAISGNSADPHKKTIVAEA